MSQGSGVFFLSIFDLILATLGLTQFFCGDLGNWTFSVLDLLAGWVCMEHRPALFFRGILLQSPLCLVWFLVFFSPIGRDDG